MLRHAVQQFVEAGMKSKRVRLLSGNTRSRLFLTLGLAVVLPALTLIYVNFHHVKSIQRDKKVEGLIHRDFQYILSVTEKKLREKTYALIEQGRHQFPNDKETDGDKRKKLKALLAQSPWFAYVFIYDVEKTENKLILEAQPKLSEMDRKHIAEMYGGWFGMEGRQMVDLTNKRTKRMFWYSGETETSAGPTYATTAFFTFSQLPKQRPVLGGASLDTTYLKENFLPAILDDTISTRLTDKREGSVASMLYELTPEDVDATYPDKRLTMMVFVSDGGSGRGYRPCSA
jgi:hypothetical protein